MKPEPEVGVHLAGLFEMVAAQIEDGDPSAALQDPPRLSDRPLGVDRVMQRLTEECQVHRAAADRHVLQIAQAVFQIGDAVLARQFDAELHHLLRIIDRDDFLGALRHQLRDRALARAQVGDHHRRHQLQQRLGDSLPGPSRYVLAAELAGQFVEVAAHVVAALSEGEAQGFLVLRRLGNFHGGLAEKLHQFGGCGEAIKGVLSHAPVFHQAGLLELRQVGGNLALALGQNLLQFGYGQFLLFEQQEDAQAIRIGRQPQGFQD